MPVVAGTPYVVSTIVHEQTAGTRRLCHLPGGVLAVSSCPELMHWASSFSGKLSSAADMQNLFSRYTQAALPSIRAGSAASPLQFGNAELFLDGNSVRLGSYALEEPSSGFVRADDSQAAQQAYGSRAVILHKLDAAVISQLADVLKTFQPSEVRELHVILSRFPSASALKSLGETLVTMQCLATLWVPLDQFCYSDLATSHDLLRYENEPYQISQIVFDTWNKQRNTVPWGNNLRFVGVHASSMGLAFQTGNSGEYPRHMHPSILPMTIAALPWCIWPQTILYRIQSSENYVPQTCNVDDEHQWNSTAQFLTRQLLRLHKTILPARPCH